MDPITTAILAALTAGMLGGLTDTSKTLIADGYSKLKALLARKHGAQSAVLQAIHSLETEPASSGYQAALSKALMAIKADEDHEVLAAAQRLQGLVPAQQAGTGKYTIQNIGPIQLQVIGDYNIVHAPKTPREKAEEHVKGAQDKVRAWGANLKQGWDWHPLGHALQAAHDATDCDPCYQRPWTQLAYIYHLIGRRELAEKCLKKSYSLATPGSNFPGDYYREVDGYIKSHYPFNAVGGLQREPCPPWFQSKYQRFWNLDAKLKIQC